MKKLASSSMMSSPIRQSHDLVHLNSKLRSLIANNNINQKDEEYDDELVDEPAYIEIEEEL